MKNELNNITINGGMIFGRGKIVENTIINNAVETTTTTTADNNIKEKIIKIKEEFSIEEIKKYSKTISKIYKIDEELLKEILI